MLLKKIIYVEPKIGDEIKVPSSIFREDVNLYICHMSSSGLLFYNTEKDTPEDECETTFGNDCHLV